MQLYLVRHAHAGSRSEWTEPDHQRPLSPKGWERANGLVEALGGCSIDRLLSSPYLRCTQTLGPLAAARNLEVEPHDALAEGAPLESGITLVEELVSAGTTAALCSHGDIIPELLAGLARRGTVLDGGSCPKGSIWVLHASGGSIERATYAGTGALPDHLVTDQVTTD